MAKSRSVTHPRRGEVYLVRFDPTIGAEIKKTRPALVIQNDIGNREAATTIVTAITSKFGPDLYPIEVLIQAPEGGLETDSVVRLDQIRSIDKARLVTRLGRLKPTTMQLVDMAIRISLGLTDI
jgi:mRNA interferase MazF